MKLKRFYAAVVWDATRWKFMFFEIYFSIDIPGPRRKWKKKWSIESKTRNFDLFLEVFGFSIEIPISGATEKVDFVKKKKKKKQFCTRLYALTCESTTVVHRIASRFRCYAWDPPLGPSSRSGRDTMRAWRLSPIVCASIVLHVLPFDVPRLSQSVN